MSRSTRSESMWFLIAHPGCETGCQDGPQDTAAAPGFRNRPRQFCASIPGCIQLPRSSISHRWDPRLDVGLNRQVLIAAPFGERAVVDCHVFVAE